MSVPSPSSPTVYPVVLRMEAMWPQDLRSYQMHAERRGGDCRHVDASRTGLNRVFVGAPDWVAETLAGIEVLRHDNLREEIDALTRRKRKAERLTRLAEGLKDPWRASQGGPLREVILTANSQWFDGPVTGNLVRDAADRAAREAAFESRAMNWLTSRFGEDVIHARSDRG